MTSRPQNCLEHEINIEWGDCDPANIVYTARIPGFALSAINAWWEAMFDGAGYYQMNLDQNLGTPFVRMELDFTAPITPRHKLNCFVWPAKLGETSIQFCVDGEQDGKLCFSGRFVCVFVDALAFQKKSPPDEMRRLIQSYLPVNA